MVSIIITIVLTIVTTTTYAIVTKESCEISTWSARANVLHADAITTTADASTPPPAFALACWRPLSQRSFENNVAQQQCGTPLLDCPQSKALAVVHAYAIVELADCKDQLGRGTPFCDVKEPSLTGSQLNMYSSSMDQLSS